MTVQVQDLLDKLQNAFDEEDSDEELSSACENLVELVLETQGSEEFYNSLGELQFPGKWHNNDEYSLHDGEYSYKVSFHGDPEHLDEMKEYLQKFMKEKGFVNYSLK